MIYKLHSLGIESCNLCQNKCKYCAHRLMMEEDPYYQMEMEDIELLINHLKKISCRVEILSMGGPGEPLLWKHFNEAVRLLYKSDIADVIDATTNGKLLNIIEEDVWDMLSPLRISRYEDPLDDSILSKHKNRIKITDKNKQKSPHLSQFS